MSILVEMSGLAFKRSDNFRVAVKLTGSRIHTDPHLCQNKFGNTMYAGCTLMCCYTTRIAKAMQGGSRVVMYPTLYPDGYKFRG